LFRAIHISSVCWIKTGYQALLATLRKYVGNQEDFW